MLNHPESRLVEKMEYYIKSEQEEEGYLVIKSPEEIKSATPPAARAHVGLCLDLLYAIYEEAGYMPARFRKDSYPQPLRYRNRQTCRRTGSLCSGDESRQKHRHFFRKGIQPHICVLEISILRMRNLKAIRKKLAMTCLPPTSFPP